MKKQNKKRGFTIVELTIVVSVIAILSAVLIPTFAGIIKRANLTADEQAVRTINLELVGATDDDLADLDSVEAYLADLGLTIADYKPVSKNYKFAYAPSLKKVVLVDADNKIVYPKEYANQEVTVENANSDVITELNTADDIALVAMSRGGEVSIPAAGLNIDTGIYLTKNTTVTLAGNITATADKVGDGVFCVKSGTLTLEGNGTVNSVGDNRYHMALWADGGKIVINNGTYTNEGATDALQPNADFDLIYVKNGGIVEINGGIFKCETPRMTLNSNDDPAKAGTFVVKGGKFWNYDPSNVSSEPAASGITSWVADGYKVVAGEPDAEGNIWYEVVKA